MQYKRYTEIKYKINKTIIGMVGFSIFISLLLGLVLLAPVFVFGRIFLLQVVEE